MIRNNNSNVGAFILKMIADDNDDDCISEETLVF